MDEDEFNEAEPIFVDIDFNDMADRISDITGFDIRIVEAILYAQDLIQEEVLIETFGDCEDEDDEILELTQEEYNLIEWAIDDDLDL